MTDPTPESGRELDARLETLHEEMRLMDLPEPPCPMPETSDREARLEQIRHEVRQEVQRRLIPDEVHGGNYQGEITIAVLEEKVVGLLSEIDRLVAKLGED